MGIAVADDTWAEIEAAAEFRRPLKGRIPGRCRHFPDEHRCVAALPSFQRFRILERIRNLHRRNGASLDGTTFGRARELLEAREKITLAGLERELGAKLKLDRDDTTGSRRFIGARTDIALGDTPGRTAFLPNHEHECSDLEAAGATGHWTGVRST